MPMPVTGEIKTNHYFQLCEKVILYKFKMLSCKAFAFMPQSSILTRGMSSIVKKNQADVVILGGGMVGSSLACAMAASPYFEGRKICLLEGAPKKAYTLSEGYSNRVLNKLIK